MGDKMLFMPDAHIKGRTWTNDTRIRGDAYASLDMLSEDLGLVGQADSTTPTVLLVGGDWFDTNRPSSEDMYESAKFMRRFRRVVHVRGNHDCASPHWIESLGVDDPDYVPDAASGVVIRAPDHRTLVAGVHWSPSRQETLDGLWAVGQMAERTPHDTLVVMTHAPFRHLLGFDGSWQLEMDDLDRFLPAGTLVLAGDVHVVDDRPTTKGIRVVSAGSLYPLSSADAGAPHFVLLVDGESLEVRQIPVAARGWRREAVGDDAGLSRILDEMDADDSLPLPPVLLAELADGYAPSPKVLSGRRTIVRAVSGGRAASSSGSAQAAPDDGMTLEDAVREEIPDDEDLRQMGAALLASDDPAAMVEEWLGAWGVERV